MSNTTANPYGAQAHARAMAGTIVEAMPTVPPTQAIDRPSDVSPDDMLWAETIGAGGYAARRLPRGARLRIADLEGDACLSMLVFNAEQPIERLNVADTMKIQWNAYLGAGSMLLSDMGRVMASVVADDTAGHDLVCGASNAASNAKLYGDGANHGVHPNARDRFAIAVAKLGLGRRDIHPCVNWFKPVRIGTAGEVALDAGPYAAGRAVTLRADMELFVVLANCPHVLDSRADYRVTPARVLAWRGAPAAPDDAIRHATPEATRAFANTDDFYLR
ncbi:urea amidolyase associated protein UAAP1 [Sphingomonas sp. PB4P5]|uniref:urea amidolyase associated protein UAAP1 n=1 Tax=Parasphingomonas puruogangriensis TaxID=3096155 RepID=UPI002FC618A8